MSCQATGKKSHCSAVWKHKPPTPQTSKSTRLNGSSLPATAPWLPPGGSCHDEISASRNRYFVVTDEGWRWLNVSDSPVEWWKPKHIPFIGLHSFTNLSPPLISQPCRFRSAVKSGSFPPGEAKNSGTISEYHSANDSIAEAGGSPSWRPLQWPYKTMQAVQNLAKLWVCVQFGCVIVAFFLTS